MQPECHSADPEVSSTTFPNLARFDVVQEINDSDGGGGRITKSATGRVVSVGCHGLVLRPVWRRVVRARVGVPTTWHPKPSISLDSDVAIVSTEEGFLHGETTISKLYQIETKTRSSGSALYHFGSFARASCCLLRQYNICSQPLFSLRFTSRNRFPEWNFPKGTCRPGATFACSVLSSRVGRAQRDAYSSRLS